MPSEKKLPCVRVELRAGWDLHGSEKPGGVLVTQSSNLKKNALASRFSHRSFVVKLFRLLQSQQNKLLIF